MSATPGAFPLIPGMSLLPARPRGVVLGGVASGVGKTTIATGIMGALRRRGLVVQPFKVGPDYIDPSYHTAICGRPSRTIDSWLVPPERAAGLVNLAMTGADVAVVEGVMGVFDGRSRGGEAGSTAEVAKLLGLPVVLVIDAGKLARSAGAIAAGYRAFDSDLHLAGVILNRVASERHGATLRDAVEREAGVPVLGLVPRDDAVSVPERYLGLIPVTEGETADAVFAAMTALIERYVDLDRLLACTQPLRTTEITQTGLFPSAPLPVQARIAVAMDRAFSFSYADNLDLLRAWGAEIVPFSPLVDQELPAGVGAICIGGGFPELFAAELSANRALQAALRRAAARGVVIYGECGGLMYLGTTLTDAAGQQHPMAGLLPVATSLSGQRLTLAYHELRTLAPSPLAPAGTLLRAHEFHWSVADRQPSADEAVYAVLDPPRLEGFRSGSVLGSYAHLHFATHPGIAPALVQAATKGWR